MAASFCQRLVGDARNSLITPMGVRAEYAAEMRQGPPTDRVRWAPVVAPTPDVAARGATIQPAMLPAGNESKFHSSSASVFKFPDDLKVTTLRAVIGAATPVFGLRPERSRFWRTANLPKP